MGSSQHSNADRMLVAGPSLNGTTLQVLTPTLSAQHNLEHQHSRARLLQLGTVLSLAATTQLPDRADSPTELSSTARPAGLQREATLPKANIPELNDPKAVGTVFLPTNTAVADALKRFNVASLTDVPNPYLRQILQYHVVRGLYYAPPAPPGKQVLMNGQVLPTLLDNETLQVQSGGPPPGITIKPSGGPVAHVTRANIPAGFSVIHEIDTALAPQSLTALLGGGGLGGLLGGLLG